MHRLVIPAVVLVASTLLTAQPASRPAEPSQADLEKRLAESLTGATLVGRFTTAGRDMPQEERYAISSARKLLGQRWLITARIQYGKKDQTVPVPVPVTIAWANDTPVLQITDLEIPGMGTFTARVLFYGDRYAGTWSGGKQSGEMFGRIEREKAK